MKVWIDLANSPHPLLFAPIARRLSEHGAQVLVTVRDHAQTAELAHERWPRAEVIGEPSPRGRARKAGAIVGRALRLARWARSHRPDVALSHNSYAQLLAARSVSIPAVTAMDFEHQPANHVAFRCAQRVLVPAAVPVDAIRRQGASAAKLVRYAGLKEEIYLGDFNPQLDVLERVGITQRDGVALVVARTAPAGASYHRHENPMLLQAVRRIAAQEDAVCVVLARHPSQRRAFARLGLANVLLPERAVDARSLMWSSNLFIGAGGTMTREAALLGVPTYSIFDGPPAAVDTWLEQRGSLRRLERAEEIGRIASGPACGINVDELRVRGDELIGLFMKTVIATARA